MVTSVDAGRVRAPARGPQSAASTAACLLFSVATQDHSTQTVDPDSPEKGRHRWVHLAESCQRKHAPAHRQQPPWRASHAARDIPGAVAVWQTLAAPALELLAALAQPGCPRGCAREKTWAATTPENPKSQPAPNSNCEPLKNAGLVAMRMCGGPWIAIMNTCAVNTGH